MDIMEMAKELGKAMAESAQMVKLRAAEEAQAKDEDAQKLIGEYNLVRMQLSQKANQENITQEEFTAIKEELDAEFKKLTANASINAYITAKKDFDSILSQVNNIMSFYIDGEQKSGGCSSDGCSGCSGCH